MKNAVVGVRRRALGCAGAAPVRLVFEESSDKVDWSACEGDGPGGEIVCDAHETLLVVRVAKPWFRVRPLPVTSDVAVQIDVRFDDGRADGLRSPDAELPESP